MGGGNDVFDEKFSQAFEGEKTGGGTVSRKLLLQPTEPVLLSLAGETRDPAVLENFGTEALEDRSTLRLKSSPVIFGPQSVHGATFRTTISFQVERCGTPGEIARSITVAPEFAPTTGTLRRPGPGIIFTALLEGN